MISARITYLSPAYLNMTGGTTPNEINWELGYDATVAALMCGGPLDAPELISRGGSVHLASMDMEFCSVLRGGFGS